LWEALGLPRPPLVPRQVHGSAVLVLDAGNVDACRAAPPEADAVVTTLRNQPIAVLTADCAAIIVWDRRTPALGVVHAGWRGTAQAVLAKALSAMAHAFGTKAGDCTAAVGPSIGPECYPVGGDVHDAFAGTPDVLAPDGPGRWRLDLREANRRQLVDGGVPADRVAVCPYCTSCEADWFHSARRDRGTTGRQAAVAMIS
jgi:hypothetical protein